MRTRPGPGTAAPFPPPILPPVLRLILPLVLLLAACAGAPPFRVVEGGPEGPPGADAGPYGLPLRSGQVVVGPPGGPASVMLSLFPETYSPYLHAGVLAVEDGRPFVYHMTGPIKAYLVGPPDADHGGVKRVPLAAYVERRSYVEVHDPPPGVDGAKVAAYARARYADGTPFDPHFDSSDRSRLYCTEFVAAALEAGGGGPFPVEPHRDYPTLRPIEAWLGVTARGSIQAADLVAGGRHVITFVADGNLARARLDAAAVGELHRRFTPDQRLGNLFAWTGTGLQFRAPIVVFRQRARTLFDGTKHTPDADEARAAVQALAAELFGPMPGDGALAAAP